MVADIPGNSGASDVCPDDSEVVMDQQNIAGLYMGSTAGIYLIQTLHGFILPQVLATMVALDPSNGFAATLLALIIVIGVISTLIYFYFSKEHTGFMGVTARVGIWFIMISFGAHFGYTVMGRISLLIGRVQFLVYDWGESIRQIF